MVKEIHDEIKKLQNVELDENDIKILQDTLLYAEVNRFVAFLKKQGTNVTKALVDNYAKTRGFI